MNNFEKFNIDSHILRALDEQNIVNPSEIQEKVLPIAFSGKDLVAKAPTGTGKTLAFVLPIIQMVNTDNNKVQALIVCPTRELVIQICDVFKSVTKYYEGFRVAGLYGGQNLQRQLLYLRKKPQVIVGTPGRILDHLDRHTLKLQENKMIILDEGDEMLDMGFRPDIEKILKAIPQQTCQKMLFSATIPKPIEDIVKEKFYEPEYVLATIEGEDIPKIKQYYTMVKDDQRIAAVLQILKSNKFKRCIAFCNTKSRAEKIFEALKKAKQSVAVIHGDMKQKDRTRIMKDFKDGKYEMLIATDVAARGIDVDAIQAIFNIDPPSDSDFYVHRIGRTARANSDGIAYTIIDSSQIGFVQAYQTKTNNALEYFELDDLKGSYTLPKDGSNKFHKVERLASNKRFFLTVGKKDMLDKATLAKLVTSKCGLSIHEIVDIKVDDTFSFVEVGEVNAKKIQKLNGLMIGSRKLKVEEAKAEEKQNKHKKENFTSKKESRQDKKISEEKKRKKEERLRKMEKINKKFAPKGKFQAYKNK